jgi:hypothetical protein
MEQELLDLRQRLFDLSGDFITAQRVYLEAASAKRPPAELKQHAEAAIEASKPYEASLHNFLDYLHAAAAFEGRSDEIEHTEKFLHALSGEQHSFAELAAHHERETAK